jgi:hypothetical protein
VLLLLKNRAMCSYKVNEVGSEDIVQFVLEGQFLIDLYSFLTNEPSFYNIDAIEESEPVQITRSGSCELRKQINVAASVN